MGFRRVCVRAAEHADLNIVPGAYIRGQKKGPGHMIHIVAGRAVKAELFQPGFALFFPQEPNRKTPADMRRIKQRPICAIVDVELIAPAPFHAYHKASLFRLKERKYQWWGK